ncbi:MAG: hypothetical protein IT405_01645 [Candidatus Yanofskybacteria bacterium]|nr:hypothetical protein [Candidatus Yanofskybacteria bacterium]
MAKLKAPKNCMDCPHHEVVRDPDPDDWFCDDDKAIVCTLTPNPKKKPQSRFLSERSPHRAVMCAIRPYNLRKEGASPAWCPIKQQEEAQAVKD